MVAVLTLYGIVCFAVSFPYTVMGGEEGRQVDGEAAVLYKVIDMVVKKASSSGPTSDGEMEQLRALARVLKGYIDKRILQLEQSVSSSLVDEEQAKRVENELKRLHGYSKSLDQVIIRQVTPAKHRSYGRGRNMARSVVNGFNQPVWLLHQLRKAEQERRRTNANK